MSSLTFYDPALASKVAEALSKLYQTAELDDWVLAVAVIVLSSLYFGRGLLWDRPDPYRHKFFERPQESLQGRIEAASESRNIAERIEQTNADLVIFFGSQSGTSEGLAYQLARELQMRFRQNSLVADLSDYEHDTFSSIPSSKLAIFLMSTYGEGDPSDNATGFLNWIKSQSGEALSNLSYAAFGFGNSKYKYYNAVVDAAVAALNSAGAKILLPVGKADEAEKTTQEDFALWKESLCGFLVNQRGLKEYEPVYEPSLVVSKDCAQLVTRLDYPIPLKAVKGHSAIEELPISKPHELTSGGDATRSCLHVDINILSKPSLKYKTGDHIAVWPANPDEEVVRLIEALGLNERKNMPISIEPVAGANKPKLPSPTTIQSLFKHHLEICGPVAREVVQSLAQFTSNPSIKQSIKELTKDIPTYTSCVSKSYVPLGRMLESLSRSALRSQESTQTDTWHAIPLSFILESLKPLTPRYYSISSSPSTSPRQVSITVAVSKGAKASTSLSLIPVSNQPSSSPAVIPGLTTTYLSTIPPPESIFASIKRSAFKLPPPTIPLLLIAAGTGIAPFRAFILERLQLCKLGHSPAPILLFYGCRHPEVDFLYKGEFDAAIAESQGASTKGSMRVEILPAYSRLPSAPKQYVQDLLAAHSEKVGRMLVDDDAALFICGSAAMAREAGRAVDGAVAAIKGWGLESEEIRGWRRDRKRGRRWLEDVWG